MIPVCCTEIIMPIASIVPTARFQSRQIAMAIMLLTCATLAVLSRPVHADWDCGKREYEMPAAQRSMIDQAAPAIQAALLPPPEGWLMSKPSTRRPGNKLCADFKTSPLAFGASTTYFIKPTADARRQYREKMDAQRREIDALRKLPDNLQAEYDRIMAEAGAIRKEAREAERAGNRDIAKPKYAEYDVLSRKASKVISDHEAAVAPQVAAIYKRNEGLRQLNDDVRISISLEANGEIRPSAAGVERIVIGSNAKTNQTTDKLVRVVATIETDRTATKEHIEQAKRLIDRAQLQAMVGGKIPSIEESDALIAKQNETIAQRETEERALDKSLRDEARRAEEQQTIAERKARDGAPSTDSTTKTATSSPAASNTAPPSPAKPAETTNQAKDAINKLRGLLGR
jgi:hypothetical protein